MTLLEGLPVLMRYIRTLDTFTNFFIKCNIISQIEHIIYIDLFLLSKFILHSLTNMLKQCAYKNTKMLINVMNSIMIKRITLFAMKI